VLIERTIEKSGQPVIQWQLMLTVGSWTWILAAIIEQVELAMDAAKDVRET